MEAHAEVLAAVAAAVVLDLATGLAKAAKSGELESSKMRDGLWHKVGYAAVIALAYLVEYAMAVGDFGFTVPAVAPVCVFVVLTEVASVIENVGDLNPALRSSALLGLFKSSKSERDE